MHGKSLLLTFAVAAALTSCSNSGDSPIRMSRTGACGNVFFWATNDAGDIAVTVTIEARGRPTQPQAIQRFEIPDDAVEVNVLKGSDLHRTFCTDLPKGSRGSASPAATGKGEISIEPSNLTGAACGTARGTLEATGVTARDGTAFAPILVNSDEVGCVSG